MEPLEGDTEKKQMPELEGRCYCVGAHGSGSSLYSSVREGSSDLPQWVHR